MAQLSQPDRPGPLPGDIHQNGTPLLDAVDIKFGQRDLLSKVFLLAEAQGLQADVDIQVHEDLRSLAEANALLQESWGPIVPILDPTHSRIDGGTAFWLAATDRDGGSLVSTCAVRLLDITPGGLAGEFESLRIFYHDPEPFLAAGMTCSVLGQTGEEISALGGRIGYIGALWTSPQFRGRNIVYLLGKVARALAVARWDVAYVFGVFRVNVAAKGVLPSYGYDYLSRHIAVRNSYRGDMDLHLGWMGRRQIAAVLLNYVATYPRKAESVTDEDEIIRPLGVTQGRKSR